VVGGTIPAQDAEALRGMGVRAVFPMGTPLPEIVAYFRAFQRGGVDG
jgi:methylmalonyl-CoA mutase cobalamin-binding domain/chain